METEREQALRQRLAAQRVDPDDVDATVLDPVPFAHAGRELDITIETDEFTHICPMTGLPDFGTLRIRYAPSDKIVELKSLKYYLVQYRQVGIFYEHVIFRILDDLVAAVAPRWMEIIYEVQARGGIRSVVTARYPQP
ncbi:MAG: NADPH-dependent 7-cyano-7-deazaguanine reductase QueF [Candidatus Dadabacteria bacterium]|nr:MAG: NADPH-dependent 7-cyano-7-deazaguanine reductase QueF [Candidatus Dadabacteria bacterium]